MPRDWKERDIEEMKGLIEEYPVVGILDMHQLPAPQLQDMRKDLHGKAKIKMSRKTLMKRALDGSDKENIKELKGQMVGQPAYIFTDMNPFKLYGFLQENKSSAPAKPGDIAPNDIVINEGSTGIDPGPAIGKLQAVGLPTSIEKGKIHIDGDTTVIEEGEEVSREVSEALKMLDMEPMEIGLNMKALWEDGVLFQPDELEIDKEEYKQNITDAYKQAMSLSMGIEYPTEENISMLLNKAWNEGKSLGMEIDFQVEELIDEEIRKIYSEAKALKSKVEEVS